jgi:hypothetical protein
LLCAEEKCIIESSVFIQQPLIFCFFLIKQKEEKARIISLFVDSLNRLFVDVLMRWVEDSLKGLEWFRVV